MAFRVCPALILFPSLFSLPFCRRPRLSHISFWHVAPSNQFHFLAVPSFISWAFPPLTYHLTLPIPFAYIGIFKRVKGWGRK
ncbi:hypothetical protein QBC36DRAFT_322451 [Triangularia setosa]|uniref:Uncharacterized protein n=1 Tax=Triangularia setosa TaxID=2587417 RepID=A0AAN6WCI7_9PEZI|nr:hypothetical protein QBC36DRAFT_322451 [Podospora setosa]